jgi:signal transduction histidine kinase
MRERYALEWGLNVEVDAGDTGETPAHVAHEVCRIVNESLANAAKHGGATRAHITVATHDERLHVRVSDNGRGFMFAGRYDLEALNREGTGPRSVKERVRSLDGTLIVESSPRGATIEAAIPIREEAGW